jgi:hypothetical protein
VVKPTASSQGWTERFFGVEHLPRLAQIVTWRVEAGVERVLSGLFELTRRLAALLRGECGLRADQVWWR